MLRIRYKNRKMAFVYKCKKREVQEQIKFHLTHWSRERVTPGDQSPNGASREIPKSDVIAEWQDGDGPWKEDAPVEVIPVQ